MKKIILIMASLFIFAAAPGFCGSPYPEKKNRDGSGSANPGPQNHMMLYEQAEKNAEEQYATITESPEGKETAEENSTDKVKEDKSKKQKE